MNKYKAESYTVFLDPRTCKISESGWCVKNGDDTVCDVYGYLGEPQIMAERIARLLNEDSSE